MITPALPRWVAGLLGDADTGVNHWAPLVPRGDAEPAPPAVAVYNAVDDAWVARQHVDDEATPEAWVLAVRVGEEMQLAGDPGEGPVEDAASIIVELQGVTDEQANNAVVLATAYRVMRAVRRVLHTAFIAQLMEPLLLDGEQITLPTQLQGFTLDSQPGSGQVALALLLPFTLTDTWALGAEETP